jgi:hypothetical protein
MSFLTYHYVNSDMENWGIRMAGRKPLVWMHGEVRTPPFSAEARIEAGTLLRVLQEGENLSLPHARTIPNIGKNCLELRINDENRT